MKPKQLILVVALAVVLGGLGYWMNRRAVPPSTGASLGGKVLPEFPLNDVARVVIQDGTNELTLAKREGTWRVRERYDYPANFGDLGEFLRKVWELKAVQTETVGESGLARLQLLEPAAGRTNHGTLVIFTGEGDKELARLILGRQKMRQSEAPSQFGDGSWPDGRWVRVPGGTPEVALVSETFSNVETRPDRWIDKEFFKVEKFKQAEVTHPEATNSWTIYRETEGGELKMANLGDGESFDTGKASSIGNLLSWPSFTDLAPPDASPEVTGMATQVVARIETFEGFTYTVKVGGKTDTNDNHYLQVNVEGSFPRERTAPENESAEDKERLDKEFKEKLAKLEEKLAKEQRFAGWTYLVSRWTVENLLKPRSEFLKSPEAAAPVDGDATEPASTSLPPMPGAAPRVEDLAGLPSMDDLPPATSPGRVVTPPPPPPPPPSPTVPDTESEPADSGDKATEPAPAEGEPVPPASESQGG